MLFCIVALAELKLAFMTILVMECSNEGFKIRKKNCLRIKLLKGNYSILRIGLMGASEIFKNQLFSSFQKKNTENWNHGLILMLLLFYINKIKNLRQFSGKKNLNKRALNHIVWYTNHFLHWNTTKISLFIS